MAALIDITVKTLDGQNRSFSVPQQMTVRSFKEKISNSINIPADTQRLIFHGRVMQDEKELKDYDIHGKTIHVVQRAPPTTTSASTGTDSPRTQQPHRHTHDPNMDVFVHLGGLNAPATSREARQRIRQAEIQVGIVNTALDRLEQRTGSQNTREEVDSPGLPATSSERSQERMDVSPPSSNQTESRTTPAGSDSVPNSQPTSSTQGEQATSSSNRRQESQEGLSATDLANFMDRVLVANRRMTPHLVNYQNLLNGGENYASGSPEARNAQEMANRVMEAVHAMGHVMHNLSDVMVDMQSTTPRQAVAVPMSPFVSGTNSIAIPIHMNVLPRRMDNNNTAPSGRGRGMQPTSTRGGGRGMQPTSNSQTATASQTPNTSASSTSTTSDGTNTNRPAAGQPPQPSPLTSNTDGGERWQEVHNMEATFVMDNVFVDEGMQFDISGPASNTSISIVSASTNPNTPAPQPTTNTFNNPSTTTSGTAAATATSATATTSSATPRISSTTSSFTVGPTTNINIGGTPGLGGFPNLPGLPGGILQNIVQSVLSSHGVQGGHPVEVNIVQPGEVTTSVRQTARQPSTTQASTTAPSSGTPSSQAEVRPNVSQAQPTTSSNSQGSNSNPHTSTIRGPNISMGPAGPRPIFINRGGQAPRAGHPGGVGALSPYIDMYLPCSSHHFTSETAREARSQGQQQQQQGGGGQQVPNLSTMVSGMMGDIFHQVEHNHHMHHHHHPRNHGNQGTTTSSSTAAGGNTTARGTSTTGPTTNPAAPGGPGGFDPMQMLAGLMGGQPPAGVATATTIGGGPQGGAIQLDLTSLLSNMMGNANVTAGRPAPNPPTPPAHNPPPPPINPMGGTLADLFRQFNAQLGTSSESDQSDTTFVQALIETVAPHIRLTDLFSLVMGNTRVLAQVRQPLREFASGRIEQLGSLDSVVETALQDMNVEIEFITNCVRVKSGVDMAASLRNCLRHHLHLLLSALVSDSPAFEDVYGQELFNLWQGMLSQVVALSIYCIENGEAGFSSMLQQYMPRLTRDLNPAITMWMSTSVQDIISSYHRNHPVPEADILPYIVNSQVNSTSQIGPNATTDSSCNAIPPTNTSSLSQRVPPTQGVTSASSTQERNDGAKSNAVPMETGESPLSLPPKPKVPRNIQTKETDSGDEFVDAPEEFTSRPTSVNTTSASIANRPRQIATPSSASVQPKLNGDEMRNGDNNWQSVVPREWIPWIDEDVERQKEQRSQPPLSDAYLQGLPAKRRRMMVLEHSEEMGNMPQYFPAAIARAARAVGAEPISSQQNLMQEASDERELQQDLEQEVKAIVESRITTDTDFNSDRFPNSMRYFKPNNAPNP